MQSATLLTTLSFTILFSAAEAIAAPDATAEARARAIAPYLDVQTFAIAHIDLSRVEAKQVLNGWTQFAPQGVPERAEMQASLDKIIAALQENRFPDLYVVFSVYEIPHKLPFLILPVTDRSDVEGLIKSFPAPSPHSRFEKLDGAVFIGVPESLDRIKRGPPDPRPALAEAFQAAADLPIQLVVLPTTDNRRVIEAMMPTLPQEVGGGPSTILTHGVQWMAIGFNPPPAVALQVVIKSQDQAAATALRDKWMEAAKLLGQLQSSERLKLLSQPMTLLAPEAEGDRIVVPAEKGTRAIEAFLKFAIPHDRRARTQNQLKQLALAILNFENENRTLPAQANYSADGKPLLSWRVHILPYLDQNDLYKQFHLDEPWDSPHNRTLIDNMPDIFRSPASQLEEKGMTNYVYPAGEETICPTRRAIKFSNITDGTSATIMIVEADDDQAVIWTKPEDLPFDPQQPAKGLGKFHDGSFFCALCDGSVRLLSTAIDPKTLRALFTRAGGEVIPPETFR